YDFAHPLEDAKECVTHSLCTLEFEIHRPFYDWVIEHCPVPAEPRQIEFSRLNLNYTVMSKRKLLTLVQDGKVGGWDDPRMPTLSGLRRRGYPAAAIRSFCRGLGITKFKGVTDIALLEHEVRALLNKEAPRRMAVLDPVKLVLVNYEEGRSEGLEVINNPEKEEEGVREVKLSRELWIERDDFMEEPPRKFFRLGPERYVRLRGGYIIKCVGFDKDEAGNVTEIRCEYLPGTVGQNAPEGVKCKAAIHWVSAEFGKPATARLYDRLFTEENPDAVEGGYESVLNPDSLENREIWIEPSLAEMEPEAVCQFERLGYFVADRYDHQPGERAVFNRTVALRDSWAKKG
ncbi:MAG: glutamate--tRNA ligase family protein, partial [Haloferula sp.]